MSLEIPKPSSYPEGSDEALFLAWLGDDPANKLRLMGIHDPSLKPFLFMNGVIGADEAGEGFFYAPDGTKGITADKAEEIGMVVIPLPEDGSMPDGLGDDLMRAMGIDDEDFYEDEEESSP